LRCFFPLPLSPLFSVSLQVSKGEVAHGFIRFLPFFPFSLTLPLERFSLPRKEKKRVVRSLLLFPLSPFLENLHPETPPRSERRKKLMGVRVRPPFFFLFFFLPPYYNTCILSFLPGEINGCELTGIAFFFFSFLIRIFLMAL